MFLLSREQLGALGFILFFFFLGLLFKESILGESKETLSLSQEEKLLALEKNWEQNLQMDQGFAQKQKSPEQKIVPKVVTKEEWIRVQIEGEVKNPGDYILKRRSRYFDLIQKAGGLTSQADKSRVQKNYFLKEGQVFFVAPKTEWIKVKIEGAIQKPGLYKIKKGTQYFELIKKAGGFTQDSDRSRVQKNYFLKDGQTFHVPFQKSIQKSIQKSRKNKNKTKKNTTKLPLKKDQQKTKSLVK